ncbi:fibronectin type III domain-containing protein [Maribacter sp. 2307ULW6-5]|uniref:fibronectin type III domain-containing protein n=1 Tax=Maribacter sp. 2307ULW6-5 TaxID=3386275 RepID=UPI0039BD28D1
MKHPLKIHTLFYILFAGLLLGCGGGDDPAPEPTPQPPVAATLLEPANNLICLTATSLNADQSSVAFSWNAAANTDTYELSVTNLNTNATTNTVVGESNATLTLDKANPYAWSVTSRSNGSTETAQSEQWRFYLAGEAQVNFAPFPPELVSPPSGATVTGNAVSLVWQGSDVDGDLSDYDVYLDDADGSTLLDTVTEPELQNVPLNANTTYFWKVVARDAAGNTASSNLYSFKVE